MDPHNSNIFKGQVFFRWLVGFGFGVFFSKKKQGINFNVLYVMLYNKISFQHVINIKIEI